MIWYYWQGRTNRAGPMNSLENWSQNKGVQPNQFVKLAKTVGMLPLPDTDNFSPLGLELLLRVFGPLWCAGQWYGLKHIIVLTGVEDQTVYINDPDRGVAKQETLAWFNQKLDKIPSRMMYKDPSAY